MTNKCEHDRPIGGTQLSGPYWGGVGKCRCCAQTFGVMHSSTHGADGLISSSKDDETLCKPCGGKRTEYLHPDYERVEEGGCFVLRRKA